LIFLQDGKLQQDKKEREKALFEYRKQADEKKNHAEKVEKRVSRISNINYPSY